MRNSIKNAFGRAIAFPIIVFVLCVRLAFVIMRLIEIVRQNYQMQSYLPAPAIVTRAWVVTCASRRIAAI